MPRTPPFQEIIARSPLVFIIGVAGDSGSGKTTFTDAIRQIFGPDLVATITLDDYHKYDREERKKPASPRSTRMQTTSYSSKPMWPG